MPRWPRKCIKSVSIVSSDERSATSSSAHERLVGSGCTLHVDTFFYLAGLGNLEAGAGAICFFGFRHGMKGNGLACYYCTKIAPHGPKPAHLLSSGLICHAEAVEAHDGQDAQPHGQRLLGPESTRDGRASKDERGEQAELDAIGLAVADTEST
jgi:hypothetical protein